MSLRDDLCGSARRWATAALDAYVEEPPDLDFAVHHLAVAVEHLSKAYLCSVSEVLLVGDKPSLDDLLILAGHEDKTNRRRTDVRTIGGADAIIRVEKLLGKKPSDADGLRRLREARNGVTHLGLGEAPPAVRTLLAAGISHINELLGELDQAQDGYWGIHQPLTKRLVEQSVTDLQLRYDSKLRRAREVFERRFGKMREPARGQAIAALASEPVLTHWFLVTPTTCPACGSLATVSGRDYNDEYGPWFSPRYFGCRVCELTLEDDELSLAGLTGQAMNEPNVDPDWEPNY